MRGAWTAALLVGGLGCLGPMDEDDPGYSPHILPPDGDVPAASEDEGLRSRIAREDGIEGDVVTLRPAWADEHS